VHDDNTRTDAQLLRAAPADPQAFRCFYERYALWVRGWFVRHTGDEAASLDLTAETFAQAWLSAPRFKDLADGSGAPWLFGIARNLLRQYLRQDRVADEASRRLGLPLPFAECEDYDRVDERLEAGSLKPALAHAVGALPADQRRALELRVVLGLDYEVVAERLGCSVNAARLRVSRALRALTASMEAEA
jgi:RNA polymerase sigma-70 factor (ECF subfamily)